MYFFALINTLEAIMLYGTNVPRYLGTYIVSNGTFR